MIKSISIPEPCSQQWQQMTPVNGGRHCESCCKTVVDFTTMTDEETIAYLSAKNSVCGRLGATQLSGINSRFRADNTVCGGWVRRLAALLFIGSTYVYKADAQQHQIKPVTHQQPVPSRLAGKAKVIDRKASKFKIITGFIKSQEDKPVYAATVSIPGTEYWAQTDSAGNFSLRLPASTKQVTVSSGDYEDVLVELMPGIINYNTALNKSKSYTVGNLNIQNALVPAKPRIQFNFRPVFRKLFD